MMKKKIKTHIQKIIIKKEMEKSHKKFKNESSHVL